MWLFHTCAWHVAACDVNSSRRHEFSLLIIFIVYYNVSEFSYQANLFNLFMLIAYSTCVDIASWIYNLCMLLRAIFEFQYQAGLQITWGKNSLLINFFFTIIIFFKFDQISEQTWKTSFFNIADSFYVNLTSSHKMLLRFQGLQNRMPTFFQY